jgi:hypothetical protein
VERKPDSILSTFLRPTLVMVEGASEEKEKPRNTSQHTSISDSLNATVQRCCSLAESVLMGRDADDNSYESDWTTFEPEFLRTSLFQQQGGHLTESLWTEANENNDEFCIDWTTVPSSLRPASVYCQLGAERASNKEKQVGALLRHAIPIVDYLYQQNHNNNNNNTINVVEFGAGSGHLGLLLAFLRPTKCHVTLLERKEYACQQATKRANDASLQNITIVNTSMHTFAEAEQQFHLGLSLHSCGVLTDAALALCLQHGAAFCLCPCCYGQTAANLPADYLPRSRLLGPLRHQTAWCSTTTTTTTTTTTSRTPQHLQANSKSSLPLQQQHRQQLAKERRRLRKRQTEKPFYMVARSADCTSAVDSKTSFVTSQNFILAKRCMQIVDADRLLWAHEHGYSIHMASMVPLGVTPKNNLIVGLPPANNDVHNNNGGDTAAFAINNEVDMVALEASAGENAKAEAGEKAKTGREGFKDA